MLIIIVGETCSGKTTIKDELVKNGIRPIVTTTTRPMRSGEKQGVTYNYVTSNKFKKMIENNEFAEYTSYKVASGETWYYGTPIRELLNDGVIILNPEGLKSVLSMVGLDPTVYYITASEGVLRNRLKLRGDDPKEARRRLLADRRDFENIESYIDYIIVNQGEMTPERAARIILNTKKGHR